MRIALIAMSGVRVVDPALVEFGVTLPGFVSRGEVVAQLPSLALIALAAETPGDVEGEYLEGADLADADPLPEGFDLVALSTYTAMAYETYELADRFRAAGVPVVIGGLHASQLPDEAKAHADAVCVGEAERTWPELVADFGRGGASALKPFYREEAPGTYDLGGAAIPRYELLAGGDYNRLTVQTVRGCPLDCEFCGASKLFGAGYRRKPVAHVVAEIRRIQELFGPRTFIELADDNSFANRRWTRELLTAMADLSVRWFTETDLSIADDEGLLELLYASGCAQVLIGFESLDPDALDGLDKANWKYQRRQRYLEAIDRIQSHGVSVNGCFIVGHDADREGVFEELREFIDRSGLLETQITVLTPFPGTRLLERLRAEDRLLYDRFWDRCTLFDVVYRPRHMTPERLEEGLRWLMAELYNEAHLARRKRRYVDLMKDLLPG